MSHHNHYVSRKAEFSERALAFALDYALFAAAWVVILKIADHDLPVLLNEKGTAAIAVLVALFIVYQAFLSCDGRATVGKHLLGLRVADADGEPLDFGKSVVRSMAYLPSSIFTLGFFWSFIDPKGRTWHDLAAGSDVLSDSPTGGARTFAIRFAGGIVVIALALGAGWNGIWEPRYLKLMTVAHAKAGLVEVKTLQSSYYRRHGLYASSLFALAEESVSPRAFLRDMATLYDVSAFRFRAGKSAYVVVTRARDVDSTLVAVSGP